MKILLIASEVAPFSKTGGLADVAGALPRALGAKADCDVIVISPFYRMTAAGDFKIKKVKDINNTRGFEGLEQFELMQAESEGARFYFIGKDEYYDREGLYGTPQSDYPDNHKRFSFLCRAALASAYELGFYPDIIHTNDWQTALTPLYIDAIADKGHPFKRCKVLFTIHNLAYQGLFFRDKARDIGLPQKELESLILWGRVSFIKAGILYSDAINTVSKKYADEMLTPEFGCGLEELLAKRKGDIYGILNGADYSHWDPRTDRLIPENYEPCTLEKKTVCKTALLKHLNLDLPVTAPLIGSVGRLAEQKGVDIIMDSIDEIISKGAGFVLLGKGDERYESGLLRLAKERKGKLGITVAFDERLAHMIESGVDMFAMPSRYEPCGLNQLYSFKYGTIPVVRATGGLDDTVIDYSGDPDNGNGFKFAKADSRDFIDAVNRAIKVFRDKEEWARLQRGGMKLDFSWQRSAGEYMSLYKKVISI